MAVYTVIGLSLLGDEMLAQSDWAPTLLDNPYIRHWIFRHRHLTAGPLIATLADALEAALAQDRGLVLTELSAESVASAPPVKPAPPRPTRRCPRHAVSMTPLNSKTALSHALWSGSRRRSSGARRKSSRSMYFCRDLFTIQFENLRSSEIPRGRSRDSFRRHLRAWREEICLRPDIGAVMWYAEAVQEPPTAPP
jgi:hypothetical protein